MLQYRSSTKPLSPHESPGPTHRPLGLLSLRLNPGAALRLTTRFQGQVNLIDNMKHGINIASSAYKLPQGGMNPRKI